MKKTILLIIGFLFITSFAGAQVIENFDAAGSLGIFKDAAWGTPASPSITDSIYQTADPSGKSAGSMAVAFDLKGRGQHNAIISKSTLDPNKAHQITYWIFIPSNNGIPDSLAFGLWWQVNGNWTWNEYKYYAKDIPKGVWYPLSVAILDSSIADPTNDGFISGHILGNYGIQWNNDKDSASVWKGIVYIDNVSLVGTKPTTFATFNSSIENFIVAWDNGYVDSIKQISGPIGDSTGVLQWTLDGSAATGGGAVGVQPSPAYDATAQNQLVFWVYIDPTFPDSAHIQTWAQDNNTWNWPSPRGVEDYLGINIPKNKWYPLYFDLSQASIADTVSGSKVNPAKYPIGKFGLQVSGTKTWKGSIYINNVQFINSVVASNVSWVAADFEKAANGIQAFYVVSGLATGSLARVLDTQTSNKTYVLQATMNFSLKKNFIIKRDSVKLLDATDATKYATSVSFSAFLPANMPLGGGIDLVITGPAAVNNGWLQVDRQISNSDLLLNQWNTITLNLDPLVQAGTLNPAKPATVAVQVYYPAGDTTTWSGKVLFDNLVFTGISRTGELPTPVLADKNVIKEFMLYNNYPNPFNPSTIIKYDLPKELNVTLKVYDVLGREVVTLVNNQKQSTGTYSISFDASKYASGVYIYKITAGSYVKSFKMMLLK
jgi:hypothetical protein